MEIGCLRVTGSVVAVANQEKVVTWHIPARDSALNTMVNVDDSAHPVMFNHPAQPPGPLKHSATTHKSISPDLNYFATMELTTSHNGHLNIYDIWTGRHLTSTTTKQMSFPFFTPDGCEVWCVGPAETIVGQPVNYPKAVAGWAITEKSKTCLTKLEHLEPDMCPFGTFPRQSSCGYRIADDGWVLSPTQKRLL